MEMYRGNIKSVGYITCEHGNIIIRTRTEKENATLQINEDGTYTDVDTSIIYPGSIFEGDFEKKIEKIIPGLTYVDSTRLEKIDVDAKTLQKKI